MHRPSVCRAIARLLAAGVLAEGPRIGNQRCLKLLP